MKKDKRGFGKVLMALTMIFFYLPIVFMVVFSFNSSKSLTHFTGFSLRWYEAMFKSQGMMQSLYVTIIVALIATIVSTFVGTITAIGFSYSKKWVKRFIQQVNDFPMMNPEIVTAIGLMLLFITFKIDRGFATLLLAHIAFCIPYVILSIMPKLRSLDDNLADAAMDLGATPWQALTQVIVPQIMPGIISGALIAFTMSFDDFIISYFATGKGVKNLSIMVYTMSKRVNPSINAISTLVVLLITFVLLWINIYPVVKKKFFKKDETLQKTRQPKSPKTKFGILALAACIVIGIFALPSGQKELPYSGQTLHLYNWGEYMAENFIPDFEKLTGAKVIVDNYDSNEQMYIKVANGEPYDLLVPSDYMIQRLVQEDLLQPLEKDTVQYAKEVMSEDVMGLPYDPQNKYSVPYFWGTVGIAYDKTKVSEAELKEQGFDIFLNQKYKGDIYLYDSERDSFMMALKSLGYSMNTTDPQQLQEAYEWLTRCVQTMKPEIVTDEIIDNMAQTRKALGIMYSGDATFSMMANENLGYYCPNQGTNVWSDGMVIPKSAENPELANVFIRYACSYDAARGNSAYVGYASAQQQAMDDLALTEFDGVDSYIPRSKFKKDEVFEYSEVSRKVLADLWARVKIAATNA